MSDHSNGSLFSKTLILSFKMGAKYFLPLIFTFIFRLLSCGITLLPFAFSFYTSTFSHKVLLSILTLLLYFAFFLPLKFSKADAISGLLEQENFFSFKKLFTLKPYLKKIQGGGQYLLLLFPWLLLLLTILALFTYYLLQDNGLILIALLNSIGLFSSPLGPTSPTSIALYFSIFLVLLSCFLALYGKLRLAPYPYAFVRHSFYTNRAHKKMKTALKGHRFTQVLLGLVQAFLFIPFLLSCFFLLYLVLYQKYSSLLPALSFSTVPWLLPFFVFSGLFTLAILPFHQLLPAVFLKEAFGD